MGTFDQDIAIRYIAANGHLAALTMGGMAFSCSIGPAGITYSKSEGDGATPAGRWPLRYVMYRPDRIVRPITGLPVEPIRHDAGWCDDPASRHYNRPVRLPCPDSHERLWRDDHLYDLVVVLGHNDTPPVPGMGSAIFMHLRAPGGTPTQGCIALQQNHLRQVLARSGPETILHIR
ncbi:MAG: L,D-transpeptidase family protein [Pseudomonadota bacterium]